MTDFIKIAKTYISKGIPVIPVSPITKTPQIGNWSIFQTRLMSEKEVDNYFKDAKGIAILTGGKWGMFCLDIDFKYSLDSTLWDRIKDKIGSHILSKMICQKTKNGGYHLLCKVPETRLFGNEKYASRYTTAYEKHLSYLAAYENPRTRDNALKIALNDKSRVLIESRSGSKDRTGGYFLISPSEGYEVIYGKAFNMLTEVEYDYLIEVSRSFNEVIDTKSSLVSAEYTNNWEISPFDDYNENGDIVDLLVEYGWEILEERGNDVRVKRPGAVNSNSSGLYDRGSKVFNCFSTSTEFEVGKGYNPVQVLSLLMFDNDMSLTYKYLIEKGYGKNKS